MTHGMMAFKSYVRKKLKWSTIFVMSCENVLSSTFKCVWEQEKKLLTHDIRWKTVCWWCENRWFNCIQMVRFVKNWKLDFSGKFLDWVMLFKKLARKSDRLPVASLLCVYEIVVSLCVRWNGFVWGLDFVKSWFLKCKNELWNVTS